MSSSISLHANPKSLYDRYSTEGSALFARPIHFRNFICMMFVQWFRIPNGILCTITSHDIFGIMLWFIIHAFIGPVRYVVSTIVINFSIVYWNVSYIGSTSNSYGICVPTHVNTGGSTSSMYVIIIPVRYNHGSKLENRRCYLGVYID